MAEAIAQRGLLELPGVRQLMLLVGLAGAIAAALWLVFWSQGQNYVTLQGQLSDRETAQVADALAAGGIPYKLDGPSGTVQVPEPLVREARMKLAGAGVSQSGIGGMDDITKPNSLGTSQFMETARYQLAVETELAKTISVVQGVQSARVHLALPRPSAFVREQGHATASVMLTLYAGRRLEPGQVDSIVHLVASSVSGLEASGVTVVDQSGKLLSSPGGNDALSLSSKQLDYKRNVEADLTHSIEKLLSPLVGDGRVRASVAADLDFSVTEEAKEDYDGSRLAPRSTQNANDQRMQGDLALGIPGALSNQPPATTPAPPAPKQQAAVAPTPPQPVATSTRSTVNNEIPRTVTHTQQATGNVKRLSVAVVIDNKLVAGSGDAKATTEPWSKEEINSYTELAKQAVGFDEKRGDRVDVINASFSPPVAAGEAPPADAWYANPMLKQLARQGIAVLLVLVIAMIVLRPIMKSLVSPARGGGVGGALTGPGGDLARDKVTLSGGAAPLPNYEQQVAAARSLVSQDPKRAAQVVKEWVSTDGR